MRRERAIDYIEALSLRPLIVWAAAAAVAVCYASYSLLKFTGDKLFNQFYYVVPIIFPFVPFLAERAGSFRRRTAIQKALDFIIVLTAMWRVIGDVSFVSGHSLFLTYAFFTVRNRLLQVTTMIVMLEVGILKIFVWNDWLTLLNGIILGTVAAFIYRKSG